MQNLIILAGNVGATPETSTTTGGTKITKFSLATSRPKRDSEGKVGTHINVSADGDGGVTGAWLAIPLV